jgi:hypothetical protein
VFLQFLEDLWRYSQIHSIGACAHSSHLHDTARPLHVFLSLPRIYIEPTRTAESFSFASCIFSFRRFPAIASGAFLTYDASFEMLTLLIDQSSDNSRDNRQLSQHREVSGSVAEQSGEQRREEAASDVSGRSRLPVGPRIRAEFQISRSLSHRRTIARLSKFGEGDHIYSHDSGAVIGTPPSRRPAN